MSCISISSTTAIDYKHDECSSETRRHRIRRRPSSMHRQPSSTFIFLALFFITANTYCNTNANCCYAFSAQHLPPKKNKPLPTRRTSNSKSNYMNSAPVAERPTIIDRPSITTTTDASAVTTQQNNPSSDFRRRMKSLVKRRQQNDAKPTNIRTANTLVEYKNVLDENRDKIVVVRFYATCVRYVNLFSWCSCALLH